MVHARSRRPQAPSWVARHAASSPLPSDTSYAGGILERHEHHHRAWLPEAGRFLVRSKSWPSNRHDVQSRLLRTCPTLPAEALCCSVRWAHLPSFCWWRYHTSDISGTPVGLLAFAQSHVAMPVRRCFNVLFRPAIIHRPGNSVLATPNAADSGLLELVTASALCETGDRRAHDPHDARSPTGASASSPCSCPSWATAFRRFLRLHGKPTRRCCPPLYAGASTACIRCLQRLARPPDDGCSCILPAHSGAGVGEGCCWAIGRCDKADAHGIFDSGAASRSG